MVAGGAGTRMGRPKAGVALGGRTLVDRAVELLRARCDEVVVVLRPGVPGPAPPARVVHDRPGPACVLAAIATGLEALSTPRALVLGCDLPFAGPLLDDLLAVPGAPAAAVGHDGQGPQPLCALYDRAAALAATEALLDAGRLRARGLPEALAAVTVADRHDALANLNDRADLDRAGGRLDRAYGQGTVTTMSPSSSTCTG